MNKPPISLIQRSEEADLILDHLDEIDIFFINVEDYIETMFPYAKSFHNKHGLNLELDGVMNTIYLSWILKKHEINL